MEGFSRRTLFVLFNAINQQRYLHSAVSLKQIPSHTLFWSFLGTKFPFLSYFSIFNEINLQTSLILDYFWNISPDVRYFGFCNGLNPPAEPYFSPLDGNKSPAFAYFSRFYGINLKPYLILALSIK